MVVKIVATCAFLMMRAEHEDIVLSHLTACIPFQLLLLERHTTLGGEGSPTKLSIWLASHPTPSDSHDYPHESKRTGRRATIHASRRLNDM